jgi:hypothetical protein
LGKDRSGPILDHQGGIENPLVFQGFVFLGFVMKLSLLCELEEKNAKRMEEDQIQFLLWPIRVCARD